MTASDILKKKYPKEIVAKSIESYKEIESNFAIKKWKPSELDSGHFVEAVRRLLEFELTGSYTPINKKLSNFTDSILKQYEQAQGNESYRMLIPRALKSIYNIRNKRGVGHISGVSPNEMDATYILYTVKWILAELVRLNSKLSIPETQLIVDKIVERKIEILWKEGNITRILKTSIKAENQILILLYDQSPKYADDLRKIIEYSNPTIFKRILKQLHRNKLIYYGKDGNCMISPTGIIEAESLITKTKLI